VAWRTSSPIAAYTACSATFFAWSPMRSSDLATNRMSRHELALDARAHLRDHAARALDRLVEILGSVVGHGATEASGSPLP